MVALHVIATAILLDTNITFGALWKKEIKYGYLSDANYLNLKRAYVFCVCRNIVGSFAVVSTFGQPTFDGFTIRGGVVVTPTFEAILRRKL